MLARHVQKRRLPLIQRHHCIFPSAHLDNLPHSILILLLLFLNRRQPPMSITPSKQLISTIQVLIDLAQRVHRLSNHLPILSILLICLVMHIDQLTRSTLQLTCPAFLESTHVDKAALGRRGVQGAIHVSRLWVISPRLTLVSLLLSVLEMTVRADFWTMHLVWVPDQSETV